ncbi:putative O-methyltransferase [Annulohypoxylon bovei var. microspora]|nr:putative O-methyltransferase [Annulohypoxylon bovei var. microspora]
MTSSSDQTITLIEKLNSLSSRLSSNDDIYARSEALQLSKQLTTSLEEPKDAAVHLAFSPLIVIAARMAVNLDLFKFILTYDGPITSQKLATLSGGEELLIIRVLRPMAAIGFVKEVGERTWEATPITEAMTIEGISAGHRVIGEMVMGAATKAPKWLKESGQRCPINPHDGFMQYAFQTKLNIFQLLSTMPDMLKDFNLFMGNTMGARSYWVDWFPVQEQLLDGASMESALLVDVGAGKGHDLAAFHNKYPDQGLLVLQDLEAVTDDIEDLNPAIKRMTYDFYTEQPVKGARSYFYHHILHDWSDEKCLKMLQQLKPAMKPGYSKLLLHEMILPERGASSFHCMLDIAMMAFNSGMERSERQWEELLNKAGFDVIKFWLPPQGDADGIVEAMLKN